MFRRLVATSSIWITVPIRLALAVIMMAHGSQKVLGTFGGPGFKSFIAGNTPFTFMRPPSLWLAAAALSELVGGILVGLGFLTRVATFFICSTMLTAIIGVHWPNFFSNNRGFEYPLALFAMSFGLLISGGGMASIDRGLTRGRGRK